MRYIASISYGKDSLAQLEVIHQNGLPLTDIVTADIMATPTLPAYLPELVEFRERLDKEIEARYGIPVTHIKADVSFVELFYRQLTERSKYTGIYGWPPVFGHWCMRLLKQEPIKNTLLGLIALSGSALPQTSQNVSDSSTSANVLRWWSLASPRPTQWKSAGALAGYRPHISILGAMAAGFVRAKASTNCDGSTTSSRNFGK